MREEAKKHFGIPLNRANKITILKVGFSFNLIDSSGWKFRYNEEF